MSDDAPVAPQLIRQHIVTCDRRWDRQEARTRDLEDRMTQTALRLENGTKSFHDFRGDVQEIANEQSSMSSSFAEKVAALAPKPPSASKVAGIVIAVIGMSGGALWGLSTMISDRPTTGQIERIIDAHESHGHRDTIQQIRDIRDVQIEQTTTIKAIADKIVRQDGKLDMLLEQTSGRKR